MALAISNGRAALVTAEATSTASQPSSMALHHVGGAADTGVEDDWDAGLFHDQRDVVRVADAEAGPDR